MASHSNCGAGITLILTVIPPLPLSLPLPLPLPLPIPLALALTLTKALLRRLRCAHVKGWSAHSSLSAPALRDRRYDEHPA